MLALAVAPLLLTSSWGGAAASEPREYAYMFFQGRLAEPGGDGPVEGLLVRLRQGSLAFETRTDERGVFTFERLPLGAYSLEIVSPTGKVIRWIKDIDPADASTRRFGIRMGSGPAAPVRIEPGEDRVRIRIPQRPVRWKRLWIEMGLFAGAAFLLAP